MRAVVVVLVVLAFAGCRQKTFSEMSFTETRAFAAEMIKRCEDQGIRGYEQLKACALHELNREDTIRERRREALSRSVTCTTFGNVTSCI